MYTADFLYVLFMVLFFSATGSAGAHLSFYGGRTAKSNKAERRIGNQAEQQYGALDIRNVWRVGPAGYLKWGSLFRGNSRRGKTFSYRYPERIRQGSGHRF